MLNFFLGVLTALIVCVIARNFNKEHHILHLCDNILYVFHFPFNFSSLVFHPLTFEQLAMLKSHATEHPTWPWVYQDYGYWGYAYRSADNIYPFELYLYRIKKPVV